MAARNTEEGERRPRRRPRTTTKRRAPKKRDVLEIAVEELDRDGLDIGRIPGGTPTPLEIRRS